MVVAGLWVVDVSVGNESLCMYKVQMQRFKQHSLRFPFTLGLYTLRGSWKYACTANSKTGCPLKMLNLKL